MRRTALGLLLGLSIASAVSAQELTPGRTPLPGPTAGDVAEGWPAEAAGRRDGRVAGAPWLRSATSARLYIARLPRHADAAKAAVTEAAVTITARHGRSFENPAQRAYFERQDWYQPSPDYSLALLSEGEREALDLLAAWLRERPGP